MRIGVKKFFWLVMASALVILALVIGVFALMSGGSTDSDATPHTIYLNITGTPTLIVPHQYNVNIYQVSGFFSNADFDGVQFVETAADYSDSGVTNPIGTFSASAPCVPVDGAGCQDRIFVEELSSGEVIEIQGIPLPHRPYTNLRWLDDSLLAVDRWSQPHYGIRYVFDVPGRSVILAVPIFDEVYAGTPPE